MKNLQLVFLFLLCTTGLFAQRDQTLLSSPSRFGVFGGPLWTFSSFDGNVDAASGGGGGFILGDVFLGGYGVADIDFQEAIDNDRFSASMAHGGLWIGYVPLQHSAIHPYTSVRLGWGVANVDINSDFFTPIVSDDFFVVTPEVGVELNVFRWFRISGTVGYQWFNGLTDAPEFSDFDTKNMQAGLTLRFGAFGRDRSRHIH